MTTNQQHPDGTWQPGYDAEISRDAGPVSAGTRYTWTLYRDCHTVAARGTTSTHIGALVRVVLAKWRAQLREKVTP